VKRRSRERAGFGGSGNDKTFTVSTRSCPLDTGYSWSKAGAEPIEEMHRDEICRPGSYPFGSGPGRQDQDIRPDSNTVIIFMKAIINDQSTGRRSIQDVWIGWPGRKQGVWGKQ
jgi:hypothetical protein